MSPDDPRCPECGEPISATASYCLHCYADLDASDGGTVEAAVVDFDGVERGVAEGAEGSSGTDVSTAEALTRGSAAGAATDADATEDGTADAGTRRAWTGRAAGRVPTDSAAGDRRWFHPDSLLDDVSTGLVGIVAGGVVGFLAMVLALVTVRSALGFLVWPVGWVAVGLYVGWTRSVFTAVRKACYVLAPTLAAMPLFWFGPALQGGSFEGRVFAFVASEVVALPIALVLVGLGYWVGGTDADG